MVIVATQYAMTAVLSSINAAYLLSRSWPTGRLRAGAWTLAVISLGVAFQSVFILSIALPTEGLGFYEARRWLLAGGLGLVGSTLVSAFIVRRHM